MSSEASIRRRGKIPDLKNRGQGPQHPNSFQGLSPGHPSLNRTKYKKMRIAKSSYADFNLRAPSASMPSARSVRDAGSGADTRVICCVLTLGGNRQPPTPVPALAISGDRQIHSNKAINGLRQVR